MIESKAMPLVGNALPPERVCSRRLQRRPTGGGETEDDDAACCSHVSPPRKRPKLHHGIKVDTKILEQQLQGREMNKEKKNRKRRRVQIQESNTFHPPSEHPVLEEKPNLWYSQEDFTMTLLTMKKAIRRMKDGSSDWVLPTYGETLASTYFACCADSESSVSAGIPSTITPNQLEMLGIGRGDHRGMETCALPDLAAERSQKRREIIQNVVFLGKTLSGVRERDEFIRSISEQLTAPSRKFAQAMGISDTLSALATYAED